MNLKNHLNFTNHPRNTVYFVEKNLVFNDFNANKLEKPHVYRGVFSVPALAQVSIDLSTPA
jgi:hypothetical protein